MESDESQSSESGQPTSMTQVVLGIVTLLACCLVLLSDVVGSAMVGKHNPISETISKLAIGKYAWIQDYGLNAFAAGIVCVATGLWWWGNPRWRWRIGIGALLLTASDVLMISEYDQYAGFDGFGGRVHMACVYVLYATVATAAILLGLELAKVHSRYKTLSLVFAGLWITGCPLFLFAAPTSIDGAIERLLAVLLTLWIGMLGWLVVRRGRGQISTDFDESAA